MKLCTLDEGVLDLQILCQHKFVNIKLANDNPILTLAYVCTDCYLKPLYKWTLMHLYTAFFSA